MCQQVAHVKVMIISHQGVCITSFAFIPRNVKLYFWEQIVKWKTKLFYSALIFSIISNNSQE